VSNLPIPGYKTRNVVFVATENDSFYAFDADRMPCVQLWKTSLIPAGLQAIATPPVGVKSFVIVPFVGITGTPVIDGSTSTLYVVAATQTIAVNPAYVHWVYALDLVTGQPKIQPGGVGIATPDSVFRSRVENQRPALLLDNGTVYIAFGSYGELGEYHGWIFGYDSSSLQQTGVFNVSPGAVQGGGIWQSGGGPSADSNHNLFVATGDGPFGPSKSGVNYSDSFLRLGTAGGLSVSDYFTPCEQTRIETSVVDVGTGAPVLLPYSPTRPNLLIGGSKNGSLYVVNRDNMGEFISPCPDSPTRVQTISVGTGAILSTPFFWNDFVYVAPGNGNLQSFSMTNGNLASVSSSQSTVQLGPQGATPVISWNGTNNNTAILWLIDSSGALTMPINTPAILRAYDPNNLSNELYHSTTAAGLRDTAGPAVKFTVPTVANGKVYMGTRTELDVYGLLQ
jgi:hypothetical protein